MDQLEQTALMLATLKKDFYETWNTGFSLANINLDVYKARFHCSDEDIKAYCATLTPIEPVYPVCVMCGAQWYHWDKKEIKPTNNGHIISWVDCFTTFCCNDHDPIWYYQDAPNFCSFDREVDSLSMVVSWNCNCGRSFCSGKNVIKLMPDDEDLDCEIIAEFDIPLPYDVSEETLKTFLIFR